MSVWLELHCDLNKPVRTRPGAPAFESPRCVSECGQQPMMMASNATRVSRALATLSRIALKDGWKRTKNGWACPACYPEKK